MATDLATTANQILLLCYDGSEDADRAIRETGALLPGSRAIVLHVSKSTVDWALGPKLGPLLSIPGVDEAILAKAEAIRDAGLAVAREAGLDATGLLRTTGGAVWRTVLDVVAEEQVTLVVAGSHGQKLRDVVSLGSVAHGLVTHADVPLLVTHARDAEPDVHEDAPVRLLVGHDGSEHADVAVRAAAALFPDAAATVVSVWESPEYWVATMGAGALEGMISQQNGELEAIASEHAAHGAQVARSAGIDATPVTVSAKAGIGTALLTAARSEDSHLVVIGSHGYSRLARVVLGATAHFIVQRADRPVLVVPDRTRPAE